MKLKIKVLVRLPVWHRKCGKRMKLHIGDTVLVTAGKDKGKSGKIVKVLPKESKVIVEGANKYTKHIKPTAGRVGERVQIERPLPVASVAIINEKGERDRVGFRVSKSGVKERIFKKTGSPVTEAAKAPVTKKATSK